MGKTRKNLRSWNQDNMVKAIDAIWKKRMGLRKAVRHIKFPDQLFRRKDMEIH